MNVGNTKRNLEVIAIFILMFSAALMASITEHNYSTRILVGLIVSSPIIIITLKEYKIVFSKPMLVMYFGNFLISFFYALSGVIYSQIAYLLIAFVIALIVPILQNYYIHQNEEVAERMAVGISGFMIFFLVLSFLCGRPITTEMFGGVLRNQNELGVICITTVPAGILLLRSEHRRIGYITIAASTSFALFSCSRTAIIANTVQFLYALLMFWRTSEYKDVLIKEKIYKIIKLIGICVISFFLLFWVFTYAKVIEAKILPSIQIQEEYERTLSVNELFEKLKGRALQGMGENNLDYNFSSGRMGIWKDYVKNIEFLGHEREERDFVVSGSRLYESTNAHNAYLQLAYGGGALAGVGLVIVAICVAYGTIKESLRSLKTHALTDKSFLAILIAIGYGMVSITSSSWMMYVHLPAVFFWGVIGNLMFYEQ